MSPNHHWSNRQRPNPGAGRGPLAIQRAHTHQLHLGMVEAPLHLSGWDALRHGCVQGILLLAAAVLWLGSLVVLALFGQENQLLGGVSLPGRAWLREDCWGGRGDVVSCAGEAVGVRK